MPFQGSGAWTEFISCPLCFKVFNEKQQRPISLLCGHTVCKSCLKHGFNDRRCPFDQKDVTSDIDRLPANFTLMNLIGAAVSEQEKEVVSKDADDPECYKQARKCIEDMAAHLKPLAENASDEDSDNNDIANGNRSGTGSPSSKPTQCVLSRPMQRKLISLIHCQLFEEESRSRAARIARSLGERIVSELLILHQYPHQLSANLWAAVRTRGCQFLGPAMQEEVLKLILLALEDGSYLSRKVLVLFVVQRLEARYPQASKTAIGHVVQLLYRASCFKVIKREEESSLMQLKEEFCQYESLRREHDSQIVQIATEAGLRISPEQWSSLLYGDSAHKSHMQSIIDKHQSPQSFAQTLSELMIALQRTGDPSKLHKMHHQLEFLSKIDPCPDAPAPSWENLEAIMRSLKTAVNMFVEFVSSTDQKQRIDATPLHNARYKTSKCRDFAARGTCPRGNTCTFAHSQEELERYRSRSRRNGPRGGLAEKTSSSLTPSESDQLRQVQLMSRLKLEGEHHLPSCSSASIGGDKEKNLRSDAVENSIREADKLCVASGSSSPPGVVKSSVSASKSPELPHNQSPPLNPSHISAKPARPISSQSHGLNPEQAPFYPQGVPSTRLTFSRPDVDGPPDGTQCQQPGRQAAFHPNSKALFASGPPNMGRQQQPMYSAHAPPPTWPVMTPQVMPSNLPQQQPGGDHQQYPCNRGSPSSAGVQIPPTSDSHYPTTAMATSSSGANYLNSHDGENRSVSAPVKTYPNGMTDQLVPCMQVPGLEPDQVLPVMIQTCPPPPTLPPPHPTVLQETMSPIVPLYPIMPLAPTQPFVPSGHHDGGMVALTASPAFCAMEQPQNTMSRRMPSNCVGPSCNAKDKSLAALNSRKQEIIHHLQEEPMFLDKNLHSWAYGPDSSKGFQGLKTVLQHNKQKNQAMPKVVSDIYVATRSTQSLDKLLDEDPVYYTTTWSSGYDVPVSRGAKHTDLTFNPSSSSYELSSKGAYSTVGSTASMASNSSMATVSAMATASAIATASSMAPASSMAATSSKSYMNSSYESGAVPKSKESSTPCSFPDDFEFSRFPGDDSDETFIPFEQTSASRFGPICRLNKTNHGNTRPVQVTADSSEKVTPVLAVTPLERPVTTSMAVSSRFKSPARLAAEPAVKPTPVETPSVWQQSPHPTYQNIARLKVGAAEAVTNNERLAYELQAVELEISMKTGMAPEPVSRIIQEATGGLNASSISDGSMNRSRDCTGSSTIMSWSSENMLRAMGQGHITEQFMHMDSGNHPIPPQEAAQILLKDYSRSWQGIKM